MNLINTLNEKATEEQTVTITAAEGGLFVTEQDILNINRSGRLYVNGTSLGEGTLYINPDTTDTYNSIASASPLRSFNPNLSDEDIDRLANRIVELIRGEMNL